MASGELAITQSWRLLIMLAWSLYFMMSCHPSILMSLKKDVHLSGKKARWKDGQQDRWIAGRIDVRTDFPGKRHPKHCLGEMSDNIIACKHNCMCKWRWVQGVGQRLHFQASEWASAGAL